MIAMAQPIVPVPRRNALGNCAVGGVGVDSIKKAIAASVTILGRVTWQLVSEGRQNATLAASRTEQRINTPLLMIDPQRERTKHTDR
jgi:hypothetical protein